jgi:hypothetical protein
MAEALVAKLEEIKGCSFIGLKTQTDPKFIKTGRETGLSMIDKIGSDPTNVKKFSEFVAGIGYDYGTTVNNRLAKEGKTQLVFLPMETWHEPYRGSKVIRQHKTTGELYYYVSLISNNIPKVEYVDISSGKTVPKSVLEEFLPKEYPTTNQGLDKPVDVRTLKLESLKELKYGGDTYIVVA